MIILTLQIKKSGSRCICFFKNKIKKIRHLILIILNIFFFLTQFDLFRKIGIFVLMKGLLGILIYTMH